MSQKYRGTGKDFGGTRLLNIGDASNPTDAVTLQQVQAFVRGLRWKDPARAASTGNLSLTAPGATIDGVTLVSGDRVLLKNQTAGADNGLYVWTGASSTLTRSLDADSAAELVGASVFVLEGTANADKQFNQTVDSVTLGTTALVWTQFGGGSAAYTGGNGINISGSTITAVAGAGIVVDGTGIRIDTATVSRTFKSTIGDGSASSFTVTHNLGTTDVIVEVFLISSGESVEVDVVRASSNAITVTFGAAPAASAYRVVVHG